MKIKKKKINIFCLFDFLGFFFWFSLINIFNFGFQRINIYLSAQYNLENLNERDFKKISAKVCFPFFIILEIRHFRTFN